MPVSYESLCITPYRLVVARTYDNFGRDAVLILNGHKDFGLHIDDLDDRFAAGEHWRVGVGLNIANGTVHNTKYVFVREVVAQWLDTNTPGWSWRYGYRDGYLLAEVGFLREVDLFAYVMHFGQPDV